MYQGASRARGNAVGRRLERRVRQCRDARTFGLTSGGYDSDADNGRYPLVRSRRWRAEAALRPAWAKECAASAAWPERALNQRAEATWPSRIDAGQERFQAMPNVRGEAGPTVLYLAREANHVPRRLAGQ